MKPDRRALAANLGPGVLYSPTGIPQALDCGDLLARFEAGEVKMVLCQACGEPFLSALALHGDPPFHSGPDGGICIGVTMTSLDWGDVGVPMTWLGTDAPLVSAEAWEAARQRVRARLSGEGDHV